MPRRSACRLDATLGRRQICASLIAARAPPEPFRDPRNGSRQRGFERAGGVLAGLGRECGVTARFTSEPSSAAFLGSGPPRRLRTYRWCAWSVSLAGFKRTEAEWDGAASDGELGELLGVRGGACGESGLQRSQASAWESFTAVERQPPPGDEQPRKARNAFKPTVRWKEVRRKRLQEQEAGTVD